MNAFEIFFHNNGSATFQTEGYTHRYDDMGQLADDFTTYQQDGHTDGWEGNEEEYREEYDSETERNGGYLCVKDACWNEMNWEWGGNTQEFHKKTWEERLPEGLDYGEFEEDHMIEGTHYQHGAWNTDGDWVLAWNTDTEFAEQLGQLEMDQAAEQ